MDKRAGQASLLEPTRGSTLAFNVNTSKPHQQSNYVMTALVVLRIPLSIVAVNPVRGVKRNSESNLVFPALELLESSKWWIIKRCLIIAK